MEHFETGASVIEDRSLQAVQANAGRIATEFVAGAKKRGHLLSPRDVIAITLKEIRGLSFTAQDLKIGAFVVEDPAVPVFLDGCAWDNNAAEPAQTALRVTGTTRNHLRWTQTGGVSAPVRVGAEIELSVPGVAGLQSCPIEIDTTSAATNGTAHSQAQVWDHEFSQTICPHSHLEQDIYGLQVRGHAPYWITARASGLAIIEIRYRFHGERTYKATADIARLLGTDGIMIDQTGVIRGAVGYGQYKALSKTWPLTQGERAFLPEGLHEHDAESDVTLQLSA